MPPVLLSVLGVVLVGITLLDIFLTVLHPHIESPFSSRLHAFIWQGLRMVALPLSGRGRHHVLGMAVPLMIAALPTMWVLLFVVAFGLIYAAWLDTPGAFLVAEGAPPLGFGDALYFSGVTLSTVGYGDIQPVHPLLRLAAVIEGFSGITIISMSIAYILEVFPVLQRKGALAVLLNEETDGQVEGFPLLARYLRHGNFEALTDLLRRVNEELLYLAEAHRRLPVLHYSHPIEVERSFLRVLLVVRNLVAALRYGLASGPGPLWSEEPRVRNLEDTLFYTLYTLGSSFHLPLSPMAQGEQAEQVLVAAFHSLRGQLAALHGPASPGPADSTIDGDIEATCRGFINFRLVADRAIASYRHNSRYSEEEALRRAARPVRLVLDLNDDQS